MTAPSASSPGSRDRSSHATALRFLALSLAAGLAGDRLLAAGIELSDGNPLRLDGTLSIFVGLVAGPVVGRPHGLARHHPDGVGGAIAPRQPAGGVRGADHRPAGPAGMGAGPGWPRLLDRPGHPGADRRRRAAAGTRRHRHHPGGCRTVALRPPQRRPGGTPRRPARANPAPAMAGPDAARRDRSAPSCSTSWSRWRRSRWRSSGSGWADSSRGRRSAAPAPISRTASGWWDIASATSWPNRRPR